MHAMHGVKLKRILKNEKQFICHLLRKLFEKKVLAALDDNDVI